MSSPQEKARRESAAVFARLRLAVGLLALLTLALGDSALAGCGGAEQTARRTAAGQLQGVVIQVFDGDTIEVRTDEGRNIRIRLEGIDAPEAGQAYSAQSRRHLRVLAFSQNVRIEPRDEDQYGRLVARVFAGDQDLSEAMVASGYAWHFTRFSFDPRLEELEKKARAARLGLWADDSPTPPWEFRSAGGAAASKPPAPKQEQAQPAPRAGSKPSGPKSAARQPVPGPYHGNVKSRVFHAPGCRDYNCASCTAVFQSVEEALKAGYRPHEACIYRR